MIQQPKTSWQKPDLCQDAINNTLYLLFTRITLNTGCFLNHRLICVPKVAFLRPDDSSS